MELNALFSEGLRHHVEGRVDSAENIYREVLRRSPQHADALHHLGLVHLQLGRVSQAIEEIQSSLKSEPRSSTALANLGYCLNLVGDHQRASAACKAALELDSRNDGSWANLGNAQRGMDLFAEAMCSYEQALALCPSNPHYIYNVGLALFDQSEFLLAKEYFQRSLAIDPSIPEAQNNLCACLLKLHDPLVALDHADRAIELKPDHVEAWLNRGNALGDLRRHEEAIVSYERAIELKPNHVEAWLKRGNSLNDLRRHEEALVSYEQAIELEPDYAEAWSNRGNALNDLRRHEEALASHERSIELKPDYAEAWYNKGLLQLAQKNFAGGFENYLRRWDTKSFTSPPLKTGLPLCNPNIGVGNLLLWAEQGIGDEIFYAGMVAQALEKFPNISLVADARLHPLFSRSFPMVTLLEKDQPLTPELLKKTELQAPIGDLGHILGLDSDAIMSTRRAFLVADRAKSSKFESLAPFSSGKITCGLAWRSHNRNFGEEKSIDLEKLEPILKNAHLEFINLQYGEVDSEIQKVRNRFGVNVHKIDGVDVYNDIDGLLALIDACNIVVTTSNVTAHLAGSIGKRGCVFVPSSKGKVWYWHLDDANSFWYPSLKLCHQSDRYDWTDTIAQAQTWIEGEVLWRQ